MGSSPLFLGLGLLSLAGLLAAAPRKLLWSDEFSGAAGSKPDESKWTYDLGGGGWETANWRTTQTRQKMRTRMEKDTW